MVELDIRLKLNDKVFYVDQQNEISEYRVEKIEFLTNSDGVQYIRYMKADNKGWFTNDQLDNDRKSSDESLTERIFTTYEKAFNSFQKKHGLLYKEYENAKHALREMLKADNNVKLPYAEEKIAELETLVEDIKAKFSSGLGSVAD